MLISVDATDTTADELMSADLDLQRERVSSDKLDFYFILQPACEISAMQSIQFRISRLPKLEEM